MSHIWESSRGGPGRTTTSVPWASSATPGAVPTGAITVEPCGTSACLRFPRTNDAGSSPRSRAKRAVRSSR